MWIDTHAHIGASHFADDLPDVLMRARSAGVTRVVCVADNVSASQHAIALAEEHPMLVATAGVHPHHAAEVTEADFARLNDLVRHERVRAAGEMGLDFHYDFSPVSVQEEVFRRQLRLAIQVDLPVIMHSRKAEHAVLDILEEEGMPKAGGVLHCFWGDSEAARRALDLGLYIGVGGPITFKNAGDLREIVRTVPLERLIVETDAPYLAPVPYRGKRNEPAYVADTGRALAELMNVPVDEMARVTSENASRLFSLDD